MNLNFPSCPLARFLDSKPIKEASARKKMNVSFTDCNYGTQMRKTKEETWQVVITYTEHSQSAKWNFQALSLSLVHWNEHL